jgi:hypothetical protein
MDWYESLAILHCIHWPCILPPNLFSGRETAPEEARGIFPENWGKMRIVLRVDILSSPSLLITACVLRSPFLLHRVLEQMPEYLDIRTE